VKIACVGVLSIIELKNARWNIEKCFNMFTAGDSFCWPCRYRVSIVHSEDDPFKGWNMF